MAGYHNGHDRRSGGLSDEDFEAIAARACELVQEEFYKAIGKRVVSGIVLLAGAMGGAFFLFYKWLQAQGIA